MATIAINSFETKINPVLVFKFVMQPIPAALPSKRTYLEWDIMNIFKSHLLIG